MNDCRRVFISIDCSNNILTSILPDFFSQAEYLERADFSNNRLASAASFTCIKAVTLNLSHNNIADLGEEFVWEEPRLQWLSMSYNRIPSLEDDFFTTLAPTIRTLLLDHNSIDSIAESIQQCSCLQRISLDYNQLQSSPGLTKLPALRSYSLNGNPVALGTSSTEINPLHQAELCLAKGDPHAALQALPGSNQFDLEVKSVRARALIASNRLDEAERCLQELLEAQESSANAHIVNYLMGLTQLKRKSFTSAVNHLDLAIASPAFRLVFPARVSRATCLLRVGRYEAALADCAIVLKQYTRHVEARIIQAECHLNQGDPDKCLETLELVFNLNKEHPRALYLKGIILRTERRHKEAVACLDAASQVMKIKCNGKEERALCEMMKASALASTNRMKKAQRVYEHAQDILREGTTG